MSHRSIPGAGIPSGAVGKFLLITAFVWALFQLYIASNLPFWLTDVTGISVVVTNSNARLIHLAFGLFLAALAFPLFKSSPKDSIPWYDWLLAVIGVASLSVHRGVARRNRGARRTADPG